MVKHHEKPPLGRRFVGTFSKHRRFANPSESLAWSESMSMDGFRNLRVFSHDIPTLRGTNLRKITHALKIYKTKKGAGLSSGDIEDPGQWTYPTWGKPENHHLQQCRLAGDRSPAKTNGFCTWSYHPQSFQRRFIRSKPTHDFGFQPLVFWGVLLLAYEIISI